MAPFKTLRPNQFSARFPSGTAELKTCVDMLHDSPYYNDDHAPSKAEIMTAWTDLLSSGCGNVYIVENSRWLPRFSGKNYAHNFASFHFTSFITQEYARRVVSLTVSQNVGMDFLNQYSRFKMGRAVSPAASAEEVLRGSREVEGYGLYFISLMLVLHPNIKPSILTREDAAEYAECIRNRTRDWYGGYTYHSWMNNVIGVNISATYRASGHVLLAERADNPSKTEDEKSFLLCVTKDQQVSDALGIPSHLDCVPKPGNWFSNLFIRRFPLANLSDEQQQAAYLLSLGYSSVQIASRLGKTKVAVDAIQREVSRKVIQAGYLPEGRQSRENLRQVILDNLHEVRSVVVPLYPG